jgi:hypothetical protein
VSLQVYPGGKLLILAPQLRPQVVGSADEGKKEVTKTGETKSTTSEGEMALEGGGVAKKKTQETTSKKSQITSSKKEGADGSFEASYFVCVKSFVLICLVIYMAGIEN